MTKLKVTNIPDRRWVEHNHLMYHEFSLQSHVITNVDTAKKYAKVIDRVAQEIVDRKNLIITRW